MYHMTKEEIELWKEFKYNFEDDLKEILYADTSFDEDVGFDEFGCFLSNLPLIDFNEYRKIRESDDDDLFEKFFDDYWNKNKKEICDAIDDVQEEYDELLGECRFEADEERFYRNRPL